MAPKSSLGNLSLSGPKVSNFGAEITEMSITLPHKDEEQSNLSREGASSRMSCCNLQSPRPGFTPMLLRLRDTIRSRRQPLLKDSSKLCKTGQPASKACRELSEIVTCKRLSCLRTGKWRAVAFPSGKPQPPKLATRRVDEKRYTDAGSSGGGGSGLPPHGNLSP